MKRYITISVLSCFCIIAAADGVPDAGTTLSYMRDAYNWAFTDQYGTARTMGMANAVSAVGGDIGSVSFNPAGSAVATYSQASITLGPSISMTSSHGTNGYMGDTNSSTDALCILPNGGFIINFDRGTYTGLKGFSIGFVCNSAYNYNDGLVATGLSQTGGTSFAGSMATIATATPKESWGDLTQLAYNNDIIVRYPERFGDKYFGITENIKDGRAYVEQDITQAYITRTKGNKYDYIINLGFNIADIVYLGANMGIATLRYEMNNRLSENGTTVHNEWDFSNLFWNYSYYCAGTGIYGKFGILATPWKGLRLAAAIQTPTCYNISESYSNTMGCTYDGGYTTSSTKSSSNIRYSLETPTLFNFGLAYTIGKKALVSVDYEFTNYAWTKYKAYYTDDLNWFNTVNSQIKTESIYPGIGCLGTGHNVRVGAEYKPIESFIVRAGYNYISCGSRFYGLDGSVQTPATQSFCLGLGYDSPGSFYFDLAAKYTMRPDLVTQPYNNYTDRCNDSSSIRTIAAPVIQTKRSLLTISATIGFRF